LAGSLLKFLLLDLGGGDLAVLGDDDAAGVGGGDDAGAFGDDHGPRVDGDAALEAGAHEGSLGHHERHALALHVGTHERAVRVVMLQEGDERGGDGDDLLRGDVHVVDVFRVDFEDVVAVADGDLALEAGGFVELGIGLGDLELLFLVTRSWNSTWLETLPRTTLRYGASMKPNSLMRE
jgi:hypothetical protein